MQDTNRSHAFLASLIVLSMVCVIAIISGRWRKFSNTAGVARQRDILPLVQGEKRSFNDVAFSGNKIVWAVGYDKGDPQKLHYSTDGGRSWQEKTIPTNGFILSALSFPDMQNGWAVGNGGFILRTNDGGESWSILNRVPGSELNEVEFVNKNVGYVSGRTEWGCEILRTIDGGKSWQSSYKAPRSGYVFQIATFEETVALAAINDTYLIRTEDSGHIWQVVNPPMGGASSVAFTSDGIGWVVGRKGSFSRSTDHGKTWQVPANLPQSFLEYNWTSINFTNNGKGMAVGENGVIGITYDGGETWTEVKTDVKDNFRSVKLNDGVGIILGSQKIYNVVLDQNFAVNRM